MVTEKFICLSDGMKTRRNSDSVTDLFVVKSHLNRIVRQCPTMIHEVVRLDHMAVLMETEGGEESVRNDRKFRVNRTDWEKWSKVIVKTFARWMEDVLQGPRWLVAL